MLEVMDLLFPVINVLFCVPPHCIDLPPWRTAGFSSIMDASMKNTTLLPWRSKRDKWCLNIPQVPIFWNICVIFVFTIEICRIVLDRLSFWVQVNHRLR